MRKKQQEQEYHFIMMNVKLLVVMVCLILIWIVSYFVVTKSSNVIITNRTSGAITTTTATVTTSTDTVTLYNDFVPIPQLVSPETTVTFYAHGDVPYTRIQARKLKKQMIQMSTDISVLGETETTAATNMIDDSTVEFMIHVGDIRMAGPTRPCLRSEYETVATLLRMSPIPVFIILGDNDVHDCPDPIDGLQIWRSVFRNFESTYWNHTFNIIRPPKYPENFTFQHKNVLFIGVNIVGERTDSENLEDVTNRLTEQVEWVMEIIRQYQMECIFEKKMIGRVVLFYHANPGPHTRPFFKPLRHFIGNDLNHTIPILFVNGDAHRWMYQPRFYNETSLLRITVTGLAVEPLLKVTIPMDGIYHDPTKAFVIDRRLSATTTAVSEDPTN